MYTGMNGNNKQEGETSTMVQNEREFPQGRIKEIPLNYSGISQEGEIRGNPVFIGQGFPVDSPLS